MNLGTAKYPEDVFGPLITLDDLVSVYRKLAPKYHPDTGGSDALFALLGTWKTKAENKLKAGTYGSLNIATVKSKKYTYEVNRQLADGDICNLYTATCDTKAYVIKVSRSPKNNDLLGAEAHALAKIHSAPFGESKAIAHFPVLTESLTVGEKSIKRSANVLKALGRSYYSFVEVAQVYPDGIEPKHTAWMFRRLLEALSLSHAAGVTHGAILPPHFLVKPSDHNGVLIDWCYAVESGQPIKAIVPTYRENYAPEILSKRNPGPWSDIYMAAKLMANISGGIEKLPRLMRGFFRSCLFENPTQRSFEAAELHGEFGDICQQLYGKPKFHEFKMPGKG